MCSRRERGSAGWGQRGDRQPGTVCGDTGRCGVSVCASVCVSVCLPAELGCFLATQEGGQGGSDPNKQHRQTDRQQEGAAPLHPGGKGASCPAAAEPEGSPRMERSPPEFPHPHPQPTPSNSVLPWPPQRRQSSGADRWLAHHGGHVNGTSPPGEGCRWGWRRPRCPPPGLSRVNGVYYFNVFPLSS